MKLDLSVISVIYLPVQSTCDSNFLYICPYSIFIKSIRWHALIIIHQHILIILVTVKNTNSIIIYIMLDSLCS